MSANPPCESAARQTMPRKFRPLEKDVQASIRNYLSLRGVVHWRNNSGGVVRKNRAGKDRFIQFGGLPGASDLFAVLPPNGRLWAIEVKRPGEKATDEQLAFGALIESVGGLFTVADCVQDVMVFHKMHLETEKARAKQREV